MERRYFTVTAALIALALSATASAAEEVDDADGARHEHRGHHRGPGREFGDPTEMLRRMAEHLDLDATQSDSINNIMEAARPEVQTLRDRIRANKKALHALDVDDADYGAKLQNLSAESGELAAEMALLRGRIRSDVHAVLTPEQQRQLADRAQRLRERGHDGSRRRSN